MESLLIEIDKNVFNLSYNVLVGVTYRMPNTRMEIFNDRMSDIMNIVQSSGADNCIWQKNRSNYDTSNRFGTNTL